MQDMNSIQNSMLTQVQKQGDQLEKMQERTEETVDVSAEAGE